MRARGDRSVYGQLRECSEKEFAFCALRRPRVSCGENWVTLTEFFGAMLMLLLGRVSQRVFCITSLVGVP